MIKDWIRRNRVEIALVGAIYLLLAVRFAGLFQNADIPGWDLPGHFVLFKKMALEYLPQGHVTGYMHEWLGGVSIFQFYAPLLYIVMSALWYLTLKLIPLALFFRLFMFLELCLFPLAFWYFIDSFLGRRAAQFGIVMSAVFLFSPKLFAAAGLGAGTVVWVGLLPGFVGVMGALVAAGLAERLRRDPSSLRHAALLALTVLALAAGHVLSFIFATILIGAIGLVGLHRPGLAYIRRLAAAYGVGILLSAWWLVPFATGLDQTSSGVRALNRLSYGKVLLMLDIPIVRAMAVIVAIFAVVGLVSILKRRRAALFVPVVVLLVVLFARSVITAVFPWFTMHYERFLIYLYLFLLAHAAAGLDALWGAWATVGRRKVYVAVGLACIVSIYVLMFDYRTDFAEVENNDTMPMFWNWEEFPMYPDAEAAMAYVSGLDDTVRVQELSVSVDSLVQVGSHQAFDIILADRFGESVLRGLLVESGPLTPYLMSAFGAATKNEITTYGDVRVGRVVPFLLQGMDVHMDRLRLLGLSHVLTRIDAFASELVELGEAVQLEEFGDIRVLAIDGAQSLVRPAGRVPALHIDLDGRLSFRNLSLALYSGESTYDFPVIDGGPTLSVLDRLDSSEYGPILVSADGITDRSLDRLARTGHEVILLGAEPNGLPDGFKVLPAPEVLSLSERAYRESWPEGWVELQEAVSGLDLPPVPDVGTSAVTVSRYDSRRIEFDAPGPVVLAMGYSPRWRLVEGEGNVFRATPEFVYVGGSGPRALEYRTGAVEQVSTAVSGLTALLALGWLVLGRRRRLKAVKGASAGLRGGQKADFEV